MQDRGNAQEQRLAERLRLGDNGAMREFYHLYGGYLTAVCTRYIADSDDVKDVMQESMVQLITHARRFEYRGEGSLKSWAARIVVNEAVSFLREKHRIELIALDRDVADDTDLDGGIQSSSDPSVSDIPPDELHRMISQLPTGYRTVFNLYVIENKSHREIAELLGIRERTSSSQLSRAKSLLAEMIRQYNQQHPAL